jgi:ectoine hydroxylase-related dioxygenase (phytanoyl-CoA dioxygenase family)
LKIFKIKNSDIKNNKDYLNVVKKFNKIGVVIIENILSKKKCTNLKLLLEKDFKKFSKNVIKKKLKKHSGSSGARVVSNLHNKNYQYLNLLDNKKIIKITEMILQQGSYLNNDPIICQAFTARSPIPGSSNQQLHNDSRIVGSKYPLVVQAMWILDEFTKNNGSTNFLLGSQNYLSFPKNNKLYNNLKVAVCQPGSVLLFNGATWHGGSRPKSWFSSRWAIICRYSRWFLKPSFSFYQNTPKKIFKKMTNKQKDLLGFRYEPPIDEFKYTGSIQKKYLKPKNYRLPK